MPLLTCASGYAVGILIGDKLHLNPVHAVVQLRPSQQHLKESGVVLLAGYSKLKLTLKFHRFVEDVSGKKVATLFRKWNQSMYYINGEWARKPKDSPQTPALGLHWILSLVPELVSVFAQVAMSPVETPKVKAHVGRAFSHLISIYGHQMQSLLSNLLPAHVNALATIAPQS